jgi:hypothetical protein
MVIEVLLHQHLAVQRRALRQVADLGLGRERVGDDVDALDVGVALVGLEVAGEDLHQRRLAGAVGPEQADDLTLLDRKRHVTERLDRPVSLGDFADFDGWHRQFRGPLTGAATSIIPKVWRRQGGRPTWIRPHLHVWR